MPHSAFIRANRKLPMWHTCSTNPVVGRVPIYRALALALEHAHEHGARYTVYSSDRRDSKLRAFNREHGTNLHGQAYLYEHQGQPGFYPANPPGRTSHCLRSDGNPAYRARGRVIPAGGVLPNYMLGIDAVDDGSVNDCSRLIGVLEHLGYHVTRPYHTGSEAHHFIFTSSPIPVLKAWSVIPK